jgi:hypothetical protein
MNGTYGFAYSGEIGVGMGVWDIKDNDITGADVLVGATTGRLRTIQKPEASVPCLICLFRLEHR